jgi:lipopolysaccharide transport system ATP-binding protein
MTEPAIQVEGLSKLYRIGHAERQHDSLVGATLSMLKAPLRNVRRLSRLNTFRAGDAGRGAEDDLLWALRDVSFEVQRGEVLGIVGRNGAGKSTLLKILSRVTRPTSGRVEMDGRVSSLLEVGTGFHPEMTGRENIFLNGTILGMTRREIGRKFGEIVDFSGVSRFLDTPIKHYSSGMSVRLAFAVAAHLDPEVLIVDEVLAVGDQEFQQKCLGKMQEVTSGRGRTILFVSHNMAAVEQLCRRVIVLDGGTIRTDTEDVGAGITSYLQTMRSGPADEETFEAARVPGMTPVIRRAEILGGRSEPTRAIPAGGAMQVEIHYEHDIPLEEPYFGVLFESVTGQNLLSIQTKFQLGSLPGMPSSGAITCTIPSVPLVPGRYYLTLGCGHRRDEQLDVIKRGVAVDIIPSNFYGTGRLPPARQSMFLAKADWRLPVTAGSNGDGQR